VSRNKPRRTFIKASFWSFLSLTIFPINACNSDKKPYLFQVFRDKDTVLNIGKEYLHQFPKEKEQLAELLAGINDMSKQSAKEFDTANCVTIDGWVLSKSEARECAWYYLKNSGNAY